MGGIFGAVCREAIPRGMIKEGLRRLTYRGYDGAGVAILKPEGVEVRKAPGHLEQVQKAIDLDDVGSNIALGHTRYASRGWPVYENTHPLVDCTGNIAVVMDGILDKYEEGREELIRKGHRVRSRTDTEILAHMLEELAPGEGIVNALLDISRRVSGLYSAAFLVFPHRGIFFIQNGQPLVIGIGRDCVILSSDLPSLYGFAETAYIVEDGLVGYISLEDILLYRASDGSRILLSSLQTKRVKQFAEEASKAGYPHFMLKEIYDIPEALYKSTVSVMEKYLRLASMIVFGAKNVFVVANGTSLHAGMVSSYYFSELAKINVTPISAAEFPYSYLENVSTGTVIIAISQSGETSDVISSVKAAKQRGAVILGITNNVGSRLALESNVYLPIGAGPEISVPATKTFANTLSTLYMLALYTGTFTGRVSPKEYQEGVEKIRGLSKLLHSQLRRIDEEVSGVVDKLVARNMYVASSGITYPIALEGALKLKEAALVHAEGVQLGELRHGPLTLISGEFPVILVEPIEEAARPVFVKVVDEIRGRGIEPLVISPEGSERASPLAIGVPAPDRYLYPITAAIPLQLFAYRLGVKLGRPIDAPPGLAKAITT